MVYLEYLEKPLFEGYFEPVNTVTNAFFLCAAYFIYRYMRMHGVKDRFSCVYLILSVAVSFGSAAWHFHQSDVNLLLDVVPMYSLIIMSVCRVVSMLSRSRIQALAQISVVLLLLPISYRFVEDILGLHGHTHFAAIPSLAFLAVIAWYRGGRNRELILPIVLFAVSICFRQLDLYVGEYIPFGTHFLWHLFNAVVLYLLFGVFAREKGREEEEKREAALRGGD